jgi:hypothetical protein
MPVDRDDRSVVAAVWFTQESFMALKRLVNWQWTYEQWLEGALLAEQKVQKQLPPRSETRRVHVDVPAYCEWCRNRGFEPGNGSSLATWASEQVHGSSKH